MASCGYVGLIGGPPLIGLVAGASTLRIALACMTGVALVAVVAGLCTRWVDESPTA